MFEVSDEPLVMQPLIDAVAHSSAGAIITFSGVVRNHSRGEDIQYLEYEAYRPMAEKVLRRIGEETVERWGVRIAIVHRVGRLEIGEASVLIAVSASHRQ